MREPIDNHEPAAAFAARLESQIASDVRRRNHNARAPRWATWSPLQAAAVVAVIMLVSMGVGGAAVAAAYESEQSQVRDQLLSNIEQRLNLAQQRLDLAAKELQAAEQRFAVGLGGATVVMEKGQAVAEAEAQLQIIELDFQEIRASGREPRRELSAPLVTGRDFVGDRLRIEMSMPQKALRVAQTMANDVKKRVDIGVVSEVDLQVSLSRVVELQVALDTLGRKLDIRKQFLAGRMNAVEADLRVLEAEAEQQVTSIKPKIALAQQEVTRLTQRVEIGVATPESLAVAKLRRLELELALTKAEVDLAVIRRRIAEHRGR